MVAGGSAFLVWLVAMGALWTALCGAQSRPVGVDVFVSGEDGYACIKIPYLLQTSAGTLLALGEARGGSCDSGSCSDYTCTDLVLKRSDDGGATWDALRVLVAPNGNDSQATHRAGNAAPVQDAATGRIFVPYCVDNARVYVVHSDDDGRSWSDPAEVPAAVDPAWEWVGLGPPGAIQLRHGPHAGRLLVPAYHQSFQLETNGLISHAHAMWSDDHGASWQRGAAVPDPLLYFSNECQAAELPDGRVLLNARSLLDFRVQSVSSDGGASWSESVRVADLPEPFTGCEGSVVAAPDGTLYFSGLEDIWIERYNLTLHRSTDLGASWRAIDVVFPGSSAYSSLVLLRNGSLAILFEWSQAFQPVFVPDAFTFYVFELSSTDVQLNR